MEDPLNPFYALGFAPTAILRAGFALKGLRHDGAYAMEVGPDIRTLRSDPSPVAPEEAPSSSTSRWSSQAPSAAAGANRIRVSHRSNPCAPQ